MALLAKCDKHGTGHSIGYVVADLYPAWWVVYNIPECPFCRLEWVEEHEYEWVFPVPYETMWAAANRALNDCTGLSNSGG